MDIYQNKYLKYKTKYFYLNKKMKGGVLTDLDIAKWQAIKFLYNCFEKPSSNIDCKIFFTFDGRENDSVDNDPNNLFDKLLPYDKNIVAHILFTGSNTFDTTQSIIYKFHRCNNGRYIFYNNSKLIKFIDCLQKNLIGIESHFITSHYLLNLPCEFTHDKKSYEDLLIQLLFSNDFLTNINYYNNSSYITEDMAGNYTPGSYEYKIYEAWKQFITES